MKKRTVGAVTLHQRIYSWRGQWRVGRKLIGAGGGGFLFYTEDKTRLRRAMRRRPPGGTRPFRLRRLQSADGFLKAHSREIHCCRLILAKGLGTPPAADRHSQSVASDSRQHFVAHRCGCCRAGDRTCCLVRPIFGRTGARSWLMAQPLD